MNSERKTMKEVERQTRDKVDLAEKAALNKRLTALEKQVTDLQSMVATLVKRKHR